MRKPATETRGRRADARQIERKVLEERTGDLPSTTYQLIRGRAGILLTSFKSSLGNHFIEVSGNTFNPLGWRGESKLFGKIVEYLKTRGAMDASAEEDP